MHKEPRRIAKENLVLAYPIRIHLYPDLCLCNVPCMTFSPCLPKKSPNVLRIDAVRIEQVTDHGRAESRRAWRCEWCQTGNVRRQQGNWGQVIQLNQLLSRRERWP